MIQEIKIIKNIILKEELTQHLTKQEAVTSNVERLLYKQFSMSDDDLELG